MCDTASSVAAPTARTKNFRRGRFIADSSSALRSFDHLVGACDERGWDSEGERFCYRNIDDEIEFGRLLDRDVPWLHPAQYLVHKIAGAAEQVWIIWSIRHQTARFDELPYTCDRRQPRDIGQGEDANPITVQERIGRNIKR